MTKREFEQLIGNCIKDLPIEKQVDFMHKLQYNWAPDVAGKFREKIFKKYTRCFECKKFSPIKDFKKTYKQEENKGVIVYTDAGYGDNDEIADVTYLVTYSVCPKCGAEKEIKKMFLSEKNRHSRR